MPSVHDGGKHESDACACELGLSAAVGAFSAFVVSYMQEKGKNLATKEDVQNVVSQMSAITAATKKIEAEISDKVWDRQKRWELRRDVAFEAAKATGVAKDALTKMHAVYMTEKQAAAQGKPERPEKKSEVYANVNNAAEALEGAIMLVGISCGREMTIALNDFAIFVREMAVEIAEGKPELFLERKEEFVERHHRVGHAIRAEVGLEGE
jgi:hypothetical protein